MKAIQYFFLLILFFINSIFIHSTSCSADELISTCPAPNLLFKVSSNNGKSAGIFNTASHWQTSPDMLTVSNISPNFTTSIQFKSVTIDHIYSPDPNSSAFNIQINCHYIFKDGRLFTAFQNNNAKTFGDHWWKDTGDNGPYPFAACGIPVESAIFVPISYCKFIIVPS